MSDETLDQTFSVPDHPRLKLGNIRGSVNIQPGEDGVIQVSAIKRLNSGDASLTEIRMEQAEDGSLNIETRYQEGALGLFFFRRPCKVDYTLQVPQNCTLKVSGVSNSAAIQGVRADVDVHTVSGPVELRALSGDLKISAVSGDLRGEGLSGPLHLHTVSGDAHFSSSDFPKIEASTVSGDLELQTSLNPQGSYRFNAVSGDVRLLVPADTACSLQMDSLSGRIQTTLSTTGDRFRRGQRRAQVQGGGVEVHFHSISGDIRLEAPGSDPGADEAAPPQPAAETPPRRISSPEERRRVLERIASGEITAEEGLSALGA